MTATNQRLMCKAIGILSTALVAIVLCCALPQWAIAENENPSLQAGDALFEQESGSQMRGAGDLEFVKYEGASVSGSGADASGYTVYVRDGDETDVTITLKNNSGNDLEYVSMIDAPAYAEGGNGLAPVQYGQDEDAFEPITFPPYRSNEELVTGATHIGGQLYTSETTYMVKPGYLIEAGATATFRMKVSSGDLAEGTYNWNIQLGCKRSDYEWRIVVVDPTLSYWDTFFLGEEIEDVYSAQIPIKVVVYNQSGAALTVGENTSTVGIPNITPATSDTLDFGVIDLATASEEQLSASRTITVMNAGAQNVLTDSHGNTTSVKVVFSTEITSADAPIYTATPFTWGNGTLYDTNWDALPPVITSGSSTTYQTADYTVSMDAAYLIAGTYTGNLIVNTVPQKLTFNGAAGNETGQYRIPFKVVLTGTNPRLLPRATNLVATPGNGTVELTWTPDESASEYTEYTIYRRVGTEAQANPDKLDWSLYEEIGTKQVGYNEELLFVDGGVENGTTYSYTVICGSPYRGYASATASATPDASIESRMLAPVSFTSSEKGHVSVSWYMNDAYGGSDFDGVGMVEYFNVYRNGVLVDRVYRSAVEDSVEYGWHDDGTGTGTQVYGPKSHSYSWTADEPVPELYVSYRWTVSAVSLSGIEGYLDEESSEEAYGDTPVILGHRAWFDDQYYVYANLEEFNDVPAIAMQITNQVGRYGTAEQLAIWKTTGTAAPDTSQAPYITVPGSYNDEYGGNVQFADKNVRVGQTYTYTVRATGEDGEVSDFYTFTVKAVTPTEDDYVYFESPDVTWGVTNGTTAHLEFRPRKNITATVYRDGAKINYTPDEDYSNWCYDVQDDPGADGTYVYRVEYTYSGVTTSREFTFVRNTQPVDTSNLLAPPDAPVLTGRTSGSYNVILNWTPAATGGLPEGYHIYRSDAGEVKAGGRYVSVYHWYGNTDEWSSWGNGRYITLVGGDTLTFVDGYTNSHANSDYYKNDTHLGRITDLNWNDDYLPRVYYITAYNRAGESEPSALVVFDTHGEDEYENAIAPLSESSEAPATPTITDLWVDWEDSSRYRYGFDCAIGGELRTAWSDPGFGGDVDQWTISYDGTANHSTPQTKTLGGYQVVVDPATKLGTSEDAPYCYVSAESGENGEIDRTLTVIVTAQNSAGSTASEAANITVRSFPRFYALPDSGGALLRWTDLFNDSTTQVTSWEIWRKAEHGVWKHVGTHSATAGYDAEDKDEYNRVVNCYEWVDTGLDNGWTYQYKVVAKCVDGIDRPSVVREVTPERTSAIEAPGTPQNLTAQVVNGVVVLNWDAPESGGAVERYSPQVRGEGIDWYYGTISNVTGSSTSTTWSPSKAGTYKIMVWAYSNIGGERVPDSKLPYEIEGYGSSSEAMEAYEAMSDEEQLAALYTNYSNVVTVTITEEQIAQQTTDYPDKPQVTVASGDGQVALSWQACANAAYYIIDRENNAHPDIPDVTIAAAPGQNVYTWVDTDAEPGVKYRYIVTARNSKGNGIYTDVYATATGMTRDQRAANSVAALIESLPAPDDVTVDDIDRIAAVQEAWGTLSAKQQKLVAEALAQKLVDCVAAAEAVRLLDQYSELVAPVQQLIDALPAAEAVTTEDAEQIHAAREAYDALTPAEAKKIVKTARLVAAEEALAAKIKEAADRAAAQEVIDAIEALPADLTLGNRSAVEAARAAYEALSPEAKAMVDPAALAALEAAEARIVELENRAAADTVAGQIGNLPQGDALQLTDREAVEAARAAYEALSPEAKAMVDPAVLAALEAAENRIAELQAEVDAQQIVNLIEAIGSDVSLTSEDAITAARAAYEAASEKAKAKVPTEKLELLEQAETQLKALKDKAAVDAVLALIAAIPDEPTIDDRTAIDEALAAYGQLTDEQKALVGDEAYTQLNAADSRVTELERAAAEAARVDIANGKATLSATSFTYDGSAKQPTVKLVVNGKTLTAGKDFTMSYAQNVNAGTAKVTLTGIDAYKGEKLVNFTIKKAANTLSAKPKSKQIKVLAQKLKKKKQVIKKAKAFVVANPVGAVTFKKVKGNKKIAVSKAGKITLKKGLKKGTYKVKILVSAAGSGNYLPGSKEVTIKIRVK